MDNSQLTRYWVSSPLHGHHKVLLEITWVERWPNTFFTHFRRYTELTLKFIYYWYKSTLPKHVTLLMPCILIPSLFFLQQKPPPSLPPPPPQKKLSNKSCYHWHNLFLLSIVHIKKKTRCFGSHPRKYIVSVSPYTIVKALQCQNVAVTFSERMAVTYQECTALYLTKLQCESDDGSSYAHKVNAENYSCEYITFMRNDRLVRQRLSSLKLLHFSDSWNWKSTLENVRCI